MMMPALVRPFVSSGIVMGFLVAAIMHLIFNVTLNAGEKEMEKPRAHERAR
jgi:xanthine/uracil permease